MSNRKRPGSKFIQSSYKKNIITFGRTGKRAEMETKNRTLRKFTYHGVDLDQLLHTSFEQLIQLNGDRQPPGPNPGLRRKQHSRLKCRRKAKKEGPPMEKTQVVKMHLRDVIILLEMVGVYNGRDGAPGGNQA